MTWRVLLATALMICGISALVLQQRGNDILGTALAGQVDADERMDAPGYILSVSRGEEIIREESVGAANIEQATPITDRTIFHLASLSKQITAAALVHAVKDGRVSFDDAVARWVPAAAHYGQDLTIAHLAYMTSGLTEYTAVPRKSGQPWTTFHYFTTDDAIEASLSVPDLLFAPGTAWQYANINYMLIARIVAEAYDQPFREVVRLKVFEPLGMDHSIVNDDVTSVIPQRANAYLPRSSEAIRELTQHAGIQVAPGDALMTIRRNSPHYGGSGVMSTMSDWRKWQAELLSHDVFGQHFWSLMKRRRTFHHDKTNDALGLVHGVHGGQPSLWYSGGDIDTSTFSVAFPKSGIVIACFSNNPMDSCEAKVNAAIDDVLAD